MFTGIIEEVGTVKKLSRRGETLVMTIGCRVVTGDVKLGDSIAVNGICLTVTAHTADSFAVEAGPETLERTTAGTWRVGTPVNLERALAAGGRLGGHFVLGHVDSTGTVARLDKNTRTVEMHVDLPREFHRYVVEKGSVTIDGISLTVARTTETGCVCALIPFTLEQTSLADQRPGARVNIECDVLGKHVERLLAEGKRPGITEEWLREKGF
jgi:riboflavin synthase